MRFSTNSFINSAASSSSTAYNEGLRSYMVKVYNYVAMGLVITGITSLLVASSSQLMNTLFNTPLAYLIIFAPLIMIIAMGAKLPSMSASACRSVFVIFSILMGVSMSAIFVIYTAASITRVFFITASLFGAMSLYGYTTKKDLTSMGAFFFMGVIGLVIASIVNLFLQSGSFMYVLSVLTVIIFSGLTMYSTQAIKQNYFMLSGSDEGIKKAAILGALTLYINFINLFQALLHLFGNQR